MSEWLKIDLSYVHLVTFMACADYSFSTAMNTTSCTERQQFSAVTVIWIFKVFLRLKKLKFGLLRFFQPLSTAIG